MGSTLVKRDFERFALNRLKARRRVFRAFFSLQTAADVSRDPRSFAPVAPCRGPLFWGVGYPELFCAPTQASPLLIESALGETSLFDRPTLTLTSLRT
jgi:hypothetical protein